MQSLTQGKRRAGDSGQPIFNAFPQLENKGIELRRGQLSMAASAPGGMKSAFSLYWMIHGYRGLAVDRVLYFSADTDAAVQYKRAASIVTGYSSDYITRWMEDDPESLADAVSNGTYHIRFDFNPYPGGEDIVNQLAAYLEVYGCYPDAIVVDNLRNVRLEDGSRTGESDELEGTCEFLQQIARDTGAAVLVLHHLVGEHDAGDKPVPLSGIRGKVSKIPETILTLHRSPGFLYVSAVKNRDGQADSTGKDFVAITTDLSRMRFG